MTLVNESRQSYAQHIEMKDAALTACKNEFHSVTQQLEEASAEKVGIYLRSGMNCWIFICRNEYYCGDELEEGIQWGDEKCMQYFQNLIFYICHTVVTYKQVTAPLFNLQQYCYKFQLPSVTILSEEQYSRTYSLLSCGLSVVSGKIYKMFMSLCCSY